MGKIISFTNVSVDGFFAGPQGEIDWFKGGDEEDREFARQASGTSGFLVFGRTTYDLMAGYWPTADAARDNPVMAHTMNNRSKIVFSSSMKQVVDGPVWKNVRVLREIVPGDILALKDQGDGIAILGSGTIVRQFANLGLIDEFQLMVNPVVIGSGKYLFTDVRKMNLELLECRTLKNGRVFLRYSPSY